MRIITYNITNKSTCFEQPLVSIIIPTHNYLGMLKRALKSVSKQKYKNYEIIIIDDASTDGTATWISTDYSNATLIRLSSQGGVARARNEGIKVAKGSLIAFLDSDDEWLSEYLQFQVISLVNNPLTSMSFCGYILVTSDGNRREVKYRDDPRYPNPIHRLLLNTSFIGSMSCVVVRVRDLQKVGLLNEDLQVAEDREFYIRLFQLGNDIVYLPKPLAIKNQHGNNLCVDFHMWKENAQKLLDIFFSNPKNQEYKFLEGRARGRIGIILLRYVLTCKMCLNSRIKILGMVIIIFVRYGKYLKKDIHNFFGKLKKTLGTIS